MIKIKVSLSKEGKIKKLAVSGHANYADKGYDIVCAGVSAIVIGGINALHEQFETVIAYKIEESFGEIENLNLENDSLNYCFNTILIQLKSIAKSYSKFIKIIEEVK